MNRPLAEETEPPMKALRLFLFFLFVVSAISAEAADQSEAAGEVCREQEQRAGFRPVELSCQDPGASIEDSMNCYQVCCLIIHYPDGAECAQYCIECEYFPN